jgi:hypothetical protein
MPLRFTIRDLLWLTLVVAWWLDDRRLTEGVNVYRRLDNSAPINDSNSVAI